MSLTWHRPWPFDLDLWPFDLDLWTWLYNGKTRKMTSPTSLKQTFMKYVRGSSGAHPVCDVRCAPAGTRTRTLYYGVRKVSGNAEGTCGASFITAPWYIRLHGSNWWVKCPRQPYGAQWDLPNAKEISSLDTVVAWQITFADRRNCKNRYGGSGQCAPVAKP